MKIKKLAIKSAVFFLNISAKLGHLFKKFLRPFGRGFSVAGNILFKTFIFPSYRLYHFIKYKALNIYAPARSKVFYLLNKGYTVHFVVFILLVVVFVNNIQAVQAIRPENYGENTIIYALATKEVYEEPTVEVFVSSPQDKILSYLDKSNALESTKPVEDSTQQTDELVTELSTLTQGGIAMTKPNIIQPIAVNQLPDSQQPIARTGITYHKVVSGDTYSTIAKKYGIDVNTLLWQNNLSASSILKPGTTLEILPVSGISHSVAKGESVNSIAKKYGVDASKIIAMNNLLDNTDIKIGQKLIVPGGKKIGPTKVYTTVKPAPTATKITNLLTTTQPTGTGTKISGARMVWPAAVKTITQYYKVSHRGLDIAGPLGIAIYAADDGVVEYAGWSNGYGYNILINHGNGIKTRYAHSNKLAVSKGDTVTAGQYIMSEGSTGWSTGPHLHFEVIVNGVKVNPLTYIR